MAHACLLRMVAVMTAIVGLPALGADTGGREQAGSALFTGARRAENGGAPCGACHAIGGLGAAWAASLGPDLSRSFEGMPPEAIDGLLQDLPFPTMAPIYSGHALTAAERVDLAAFLSARSGAPAARGRRILPSAVALAVLALAGLGFLGRRRKSPIRAQLTVRAPGAGPLSRAPATAGATADATHASGGAR